MDDRYQYQTRRVKALRWLRWKPAYALLAAYTLAGWLLRGAPPLEYPSEPETGWPGYKLTRRGTAEHLWAMCMGAAAGRMRHTFTLDEVFAKLRQSD